MRCSVRGWLFSFITDMPEAIHVPRRQYLTGAGTIQEYAGCSIYHAGNTPADIVLPPQKNGERFTVFLVNLSSGTGTVRFKETSGGSVFLTRPVGAIEDITFNGLWDRWWYFIEQRNATIA